MNPFITNFLARIVSVIAVVFGAHLLILDYLKLELFANKIILSYLTNTLFAIASYLVLFLLRERIKNQIGYFFVGGSFVKLVLFFLLFYSSYRADGEISRIEFFAFFTPYTFALIIEVFSLSKWLNKME